MTSLLQRLQRGLAGRYAIQREPGQGGMAVAFLATDLRHDRAVAVKVLRPEIPADIGAERFLRGIKLAAGLTHPPILSVHDSGVSWSANKSIPWAIVHGVLSGIYLVYYAIRYR